MKTGILGVTMMLAALTVVAFGHPPAGPAGQVEFQRYDSYFERNDDGLKAIRKSYLLLTSQDEFDKIFHPAATMGENHFLPDHTFDSKIVVATVARGAFTRKYDVSKVTARNGALYVWYTFTDTPSTSARFASPLILAVDKGKYSRVVFMENGKRTRTVAIP